MTPEQCLKSMSEDCLVEVAYVQIANTAFDFVLWTLRKVLFIST